MIAITILLTYISIMLTIIVARSFSVKYNAPVKSYNKVVHLTADHEDKLKSKIGIEE